MKAYQQMMAMSSTGLCSAKGAVVVSPEELSSPSGGVNAVVAHFSFRLVTACAILFHKRFETAKTVPRSEATVPPWLCGFHEVLHGASMVTHDVEEPATWLRPSPIGVKVGMSKGFFHAQVALEQVSTGARVYGVHKFCVIPGEVDLVRFEQRSSSVQSYKKTFQKKY